MPKRTKSLLQTPSSNKSKPLFACGNQKCFTPTHRGGSLDQQMWEEIMCGINAISDKVVKMSKSKKQKKQNTRENLQSFAFQSVCEPRFEKPFNQQQKSRQFYSQNLELVNPSYDFPCHELMAKLDRVTKKNEELEKENEFLQRKLLFKEKEQRKLMWEFEQAQ